MDEEKWKVGGKSRKLNARSLAFAGSGFLARWQGESARDEILMQVMRNINSSYTESEGEVFCSDLESGFLLNGA